MIVIRDSNGDLLELEAATVPDRLDTSISLLQVLMHAQHEGVLTYGDIRFGAITNRSDEENISSPGRLKALTGVHATYNNQPPETRVVHGRNEQFTDLEEWFNERKPCMVVHGIAGIGKSTLVAHWLNQQMEKLLIYRFAGIHVNHGTHLLGQQLVYFTGLVSMSHMTHTT